MAESDPKMVKARMIAELLNELGVFCYVEVNNTQYKFELNVKDLVPSSPIFGPNQGNIENTKYTMIPVEDANKVYRIGKQLFDTYLKKNVDYIPLKTMRFVDQNKLGRMQSIQTLLVEDMRKLAKLLYGDTYESLFRKSYLYAYEFFAKENKKYRKELDDLRSNIEMTWKDVERYFAQIAELKRIAEKNGTSMNVKALKTPGLKAAYKTYHVPKTFDAYCNEIGFTTIYYGFHDQDFINEPIQKKASSIRQFSDIKKLFDFPMQAEELFDSLERD